MKPQRHTVVKRVVVHIAHRGYLYAGIFLHHLHSVVVADFGTTGTQVEALAAYAGRQVHHIEGEMFARNEAVDHKNVTGAEIILLLLVQGYVHLAALEIERNGLAVQISELGGIVEQGHVHAAAVRTVIMDYLIVCSCNLRVCNEILEHETVLYLADSQDGMEASIVLCHCGNDLGHVVHLLVVLLLGPPVLPVREELLVVLRRVVVDVEEVLEVIETHDIVAAAAFLREERSAEQQ